MQTQIQTGTVDSKRRPWLAAYRQFLFSREENFVLKVAPIALLLGSPELVVGSFLPVVGEVSDLTAAILWVIVIARTMQAVRKYR